MTNGKKIFDEIVYIRSTVQDEKTIMINQGFLSELSKVFDDKKLIEIRKDYLTRGVYGIIVEDKRKKSGRSVYLVTTNNADIKIYRITRGKIYEDIGGKLSGGLDVIVNKSVIKWEWNERLKVHIWLRNY